jgi:hypothetical protein
VVLAEFIQLLDWLDNICFVFILPHVPRFGLDTSICCLFDALPTQTKLKTSYSSGRMLPAAESPIHCTPAWCQCFCGSCYQSESLNPLIPQKEPFFAAEEWPWQVFFFNTVAAGPFDLQIFYSVEHIIRGSKTNK